MNVMRQIASLAEMTPHETVVEIGAGLGFLTAELADHAGRVIAVEIDPRLLAVLKERFSGHDKVEVVAGDVLDYDFASADPGGKIKVIGNIPYNISSQILFRLIEFRRSISSMVLMFQRELAERIMASPGKKDYGIPSVMIARYTSATREMTVPPTCFHPEPAVFSSVLRFVMRDIQATPDEERLFIMTVRAAFAKRRKTLWNNLRSAGFQEDILAGVLAKTEISGQRRAETLAVEEFTRLAAALAATGQAQKILDKPNGL
jgi:16S rRNA (adenine1518-N6/adenine1519-N6)-dimethyltransferase